MIIYQQFKIKTEILYQPLFPFNRFKKINKYKFGHFYYKKHMPTIMPIINHCIMEIHWIFYNKSQECQVKCFNILYIQKN